MRCSNSTRYAVYAIYGVYDGLACCKTLDGTERRRIIELPDTRFAARTAPGGRGIAPTTLKNKARPPQRQSSCSARRGRERLPWDKTSNQAAANASVQALIARTQP